jgi:hypothetical protein
MLLQRVLLSDHHHHVAVGVCPFHAERVLDLLHQRTLHWLGYTGDTDHGANAALSICGWALTL